MESSIIWTCTYCNKVPSRQSARRCPFCGRILTAWDHSKDPIERQPEWPQTKPREEKDTNGVDYTQFFDKTDTIGREKNEL